MNTLNNYQKLKSVYLNARGKNLYLLLAAMSKVRKTGRICYGLQCKFIFYYNIYNKMT